MNTIFKRAVDVVEAIANDIKQIKTNMGVLQTDVNSVRTLIGENPNPNPDGAASDLLKPVSNTDSISNQTLITNIDVVSTNGTTKTTTEFVRNFDGVIIDIVTKTVNV